MVLTALVVGGGFAVSTASAAETVTPMVGRYATVESAVAVPAMSQSDYLTTVHGLLAGQEHFEMTDAAYVKSGRGMCAALSTGTNWSTLAKTTVEVDVDTVFFRAFVLASIQTFCPDQIGALYR